MDRGIENLECLRRQSRVATDERRRHGPRLPSRRRRQPLLRDGGRVHAPPRQGVPPARGAGGATGHAHAAARGRQALPVHPQPDVRPDHRRGLHGSPVPRSDPRGRRPAVAHEGGAAPAGVPEPRRADRGHGRAEPRSRADVPDARVRHRTGAARRHPRHHGDVARVQPVARRGLGILVPGPDHRGADALARRPRRRRRGVGVAARPRRADGPPAPGAGPHRERAGPVLRPSRSRPRVGAPRRGRRSGRVPPR